MDIWINIYPYMDIFIYPNKDTKRLYPNKAILIYPIFNRHSPKLCVKKHNRSKRLSYVQICTSPDLDIYFHIK